MIERPGYTHTYAVLAPAAGRGFADEWLELPDSLDADRIAPGEALGRIVWWFWHDLNQPWGAVDVLAAFVRRLAGQAYGFDSVLKAVLVGLHSALPGEATQDEYEALRDYVWKSARYR